MQRFAILLPGLFLAVSMMYGQTPQATLLGRWYEDTLVGSSAYDNTYNEVWGFAVEGHEYAIIGSTAGTHFIEVTDPTQPTEVFFFAGKAQGKSIVHRDYETYNGFIYAVCDEGQSSLQIIDIRQMPDTAFVVYDSNNLVNRSHNIEIDTSQGMLYTFATSGGSGGFSAMRVYDLADPANPALIGAYNTFGDITAGHVHDGYVRNGLAFLNCGYDGLAIVDFTDPANPVALGTLPDYPAKGYNHSGWGDESGDYYYLADENHATPMKVLDVSDPTEIKVLGTFDAQVPNPNTINWFGVSISMCPITTKDWWYSISVTHPPLCPLMHSTRAMSQMARAIKVPGGCIRTSRQATSWYPICRRACLFSRRWTKPSPRQHHPVLKLPR